MKAGLAAFDTIPAGGIWQIVCFIGLIEIGYAVRKDGNTLYMLNVSSKNIFRTLFDYFFFSTEEIAAVQLEKSGWDQDTINKKLAIELNNGRAAQMGILALMVHEKLDNDPYVINTLLGFPGMRIDCFDMTFQFCLLITSDLLF